MSIFNKPDAPEKAAIEKRSRRETSPEKLAAGSQPGVKREPHPSTDPSKQGESAKQ